MAVRLVAEAPCLLRHFPMASTLHIVTCLIYQNIEHKKLESSRSYQYFQCRELLITFHENLALYTSFGLDPFSTISFVHQEEPKLLNLPLINHKCHLVAKRKGGKWVEIKIETYILRNDLTDKAHIAFMFNGGQSPGSTLSPICTKNCNGHLQSMLYSCTT